MQFNSIYIYRLLADLSGNHRDDNVNHRFERQLQWHRVVGVRRYFVQYKEN